MDSYKQKIANKEPIDEDLTQLIKLLSENGIGPSDNNNQSKAIKDSSTSSSTSLSTSTTTRRGIIPHGSNNSFG